MNEAAATAPNHELRLERDIDMPIAKLWRCWTEPSLLKQWFCPKPWFVSEARMDLCTGGEFFTMMDGPEGEQFGEPGVYLIVDTHKRLRFTDAFTPGWLPGSRAFMVGDIEFIDLGAGRTRYIARSMHWNEEARIEHEAMGFHAGWSAATDQLVALAATLP